MKLFNTITSIIVIIVFFTLGCNETSKPDEEVIHVSDNLIPITQKQFDFDEMKIGEVIPYLFEDEIICNGYITAPTFGIAQISTHVSGIVKSINCTLGENIKKGQILATLSSSDLIILQQSFIETSTKLKKLKSDYERSKVLYNENIGAEKDFVNIESKYNSTNAVYNSIKLQLEMLSLDVSKIESGEFYSVFPIIAPISGNITSINIMLGQSVDEQIKIIEIVDINKLQLQLSVFENDVIKLKPGQHIRFNSLGNKNIVHHATLTSIGKTIITESMTVLCIAKIIEEDEVNFINQSYIQARIIVDQNKADALPNEAIVKSGDNYYVFVVDKSENDTYYLRQEKVIIGSSSNGFTEIIDGKDLEKVITKGVYNLSTE